MRRRMPPIVAAIALVTGLSTPVFAQADLVDGEVTKVDSQAGTCTR